MPAVVAADLVVQLTTAVVAVVVAPAEAAVAMDLRGLSVGYKPAVVVEAVLEAEAAAEVGMAPLRDSKAVVMALAAVAVVVVAE